MDMRLFFTVLSTVFVAEIADKTQLATLLYATNAPQSRLTVFLGSALALTLASAIAVLVGSALSQVIPPRVLSWVAGAAFIAVGVWTIVRGV